MQSDMWLRVYHTNYYRAENLKIDVIHHKANDLNRYDHMYMNCINLHTISSNITMMPAVDYTSMFENCQKLINVPHDFLFNTKQPFDTSFPIFNEYGNIIYQNSIPIYTVLYDNTFKNCYSLSGIPQDFIFDEYAYSASAMFYNCYNLQEIPSGILLTNSKMINNVYAMFEGCTSIKTMPVRIYGAINSCI